MPVASSKFKFELSGYYFTGLIGLVLLGFWPSYFSKFFDGSGRFSFYFHFHAAVVGLWILLLIIQPLLIRKRKMALHRFLGKLSYGLFPLLFVSILLLAHSRIQGLKGDLGLNLFVPFKDLLIIGVAYYIAIRYRYTVDIHARGMVATGLVCIEPALSRLLYNTTHLVPFYYLATIAVIYILLIVLIIRERKQPVGRWVFPLILGLYAIVHAIILFQIRIGPWELFCKWFASLPIT